MNDLYQSPVLYALGWAIAGSFWQMGLLWMVHQLLFVFPFRQKPGIKHGSAVMLLGAGAIWFLLTFVNRLNSIREIQSYFYRIDSETQVSMLNSGLSLSSIITEAEKFLPYFSAAYLVVLALLFFRLVQGLVLTQQISNSKRLYPSLQWQHFVDRLCVQLNINREVMVYLSETITVPATIGFIKPVILLPVATLNNLTINQAEAIILHEIAHIRRFDYFINIVVSIVETILFFNPFARLLSVSIRKERELCCDDFVIQYQRDPQCYANALLSLEKSRNSVKLAMAATGKETLLLGRVKRILQVPDQPIQYRHHLMALFVVATMIMLTAILNPPKSNLHYTASASSLSQQQDGNKFYYSLPTIFNSIRKEIPPVNISTDNEIKVKEQKTARLEKKVKNKFDRTEAFVFAENAERFKEVADQMTPIAPEDAWAFFSPEVNTAPVFPPVAADKKYFFNVQPDVQVKEDSRRRSPAPDLWMKNKQKRQVNPGEFPAMDEESLLRIYSELDLEKMMAGQEKVKVAIAGQPLQNLMPEVRNFEQQILRKKAMRDEKEQASLHEDLLQTTRERTRSKAVVRTFSSEDGTLISIVHDNGKIEITVKDNR